MGEAERKVSAIQFFDEQVSAAPDGKDPDTGLSNREMAARKAFTVLQERSREQGTKSLLAIPPRNAVIEATPQGPRIRLGRTAKQLMIDHENGILTDADYAAELRLLRQWQTQGLGVQ